MRRHLRSALVAGVGALLVGVVPAAVEAAPLDSAAIDRVAAAVDQRPFWARPGQPTEGAGSASALAAQVPIPVSADEAFARAASWLTADAGSSVPYSQSLCFPGFSGVPCSPPKFRTDCSGMVSMAFGLDASYTTPDMDDSWFSTAITKAELQPGDIMLNTTLGDGHVALFEKWVDSSQNEYRAYEQAGDSGMAHRKIPYPYFGTYPMDPYRYKGMTPASPPTAPSGVTDLADVNGDGHDELTTITPTGDVRAYWYNSSLGRYDGTYATVAPGFTDPTRTTFGDVNSDGADELIAITSTGDVNAYWYNTTLGRYDGTYATVAPGFTDPTRTKLGDVNADGADELIAITSTGDVHAYWYNDVQGRYDGTNSIVAMGFAP